MSKVKTAGSKLKDAASYVGTQVKKAGSSVGSGLKKAGSTIWTFGKKIFGKIPSLLAKIPKFFGKKK